MNLIDALIITYLVTLGAVLNHISSLLKHSLEKPFHIVTIESALGKTKADIILRGGVVANVQTKEMLESDVVITALNFNFFPILSKN